MKTYKYIDNEEFKQELLNWRNSAADPEQRLPSERLGQIFLDLHNHILLHRNFCRYNQDLKDEMLSYSIYRILKRGLKTYNFKDSPFSYFTRAVFINYISIIKKYYTRMNNHLEYVKGLLAKIDVSNQPWIEKYLKEFKTYQDQ